MTRFSARTINSSTVPVPLGSIWDIITDPNTLADLTPLVRTIEASGTQWLWTLNGIGALGIEVAPTFTERMRFVEGRRIIFEHDPPPGTKEQAAVDGVYDLAPTPGAPDESTDLKIDLTLSIELPLPRISRAAVEPIIKSTMRITGRQFAANLYERLDLDPATATIVEHTTPQG